MDKELKRPISRLKRFAGEAVKTVVSFGILATAIGFVIVMSLRDRSAVLRSPDTLKPMVSIVSAVEYTGPLELVLSGSVVPYREVRLAAEVGGIIVEKTPECRAGNYVRAGTTLMVIDRQNYDLEVATVLAELKQAEATIREVEEEITGLEATIELSQSEVNLIQRELERNSRLAGVASRSEIEQWERNLLTAQTQLVNRQNNLGTARTRLDRMKAGLELTKRKYERALLNLDRTVVRAPSDGVIVVENVQQGDLVAVGSPLLQFEDTQHAEVLVNLSQRDMSWLQEHLPNEPQESPSGDRFLQDAYHLPSADVEVFDPREPAVSWRGVLSRFDGIGRDELTRSTPVRITIDQPVVASAAGPRALVRGMFVRCRILVPPDRRRSDDRMVAIPAKGLRPGNFVWTVENSKLRRHAVEIIGLAPESADEDPSQRPVVVRWKSGALEPGAEIVISPLSQVAPGVEVQVANGSQTINGAPPPAANPSNAQSQPDGANLGT